MTKACKTCMIAILALTSICSLAQTCTSGDCQVGTISGPFSATQLAENTVANFSVCKSSGCQTGSWTADQIEGIDAQQNLGTSYQFYDGALDLDTNVAVGPTVSGEHAQVLQWVNEQYIQAFDKVTGNPIFTTAGGTTAVPVSVARLWSETTQTECRNTTGNVQVLFDRIDNVFVINRRVYYTSNSIEHYAWCIAVSTSNDLSSGKIGWYAYEYVMDTVIPCIPSSNNCTTGTDYYYFPDWPRIGTWSNGFYITFDLENPSDGYPESGFEACVLDRADMAKGKPTNPMVCYSYLVPASEQPTLIHSLDVADIDSPTGPASTEPEYFLGVVNPSDAQQGEDGTHWCTSQSTPCTSSQLALFTWGSGGLSGPTLLNVDSFTPGCYTTEKAGGEINTICVPEPSTNPATLGGYGGAVCEYYNTPCLDSLGDRMMNRLAYNNLSSSGSGPNGEYLTASHVVMENANNQSVGVRYYIFQVSNGSASVLVNSGGSSGPPDLKDPNATLSYFMSSGALDKNGNLGITYTTSGPKCSSCSTQPHPAIYFDVLPWQALTPDPATLIIAGEGDEENTFHWGEYAATVIDPSDNLTFYGIGEYFNTNQTGKTGCTTASSDCYTWQTRILRGQYGNPF